MQNIDSQKAVFLDRDGVVNRERGDYTWRSEDFEILPGVLDYMAAWKERGYKLAVVTNQGGVAKGLYSEDDVHALHQYLQGQCLLKGFAIDAFYFCPHHPEYSGKCLCRKPGSLMLEKAMHALGVLPENAVFIGDATRDMQAADRVGVKGILREANNGLSPEILPWEE